MTNVFLLNGHPDSSPDRLCSALCKAYAEGAYASGHVVRRFDLAKLDFPLITSLKDFEADEPPADIKTIQAAIKWADYLVIVHPLWLGGPPARLKGLLEQAFRYGFAIGKPGSKGRIGLLKGRSARVIVTMGMPAWLYRLGFGVFGVRSVERSVLFLSGVRPVRRTLIGGVGALTANNAEGILRKVRTLGARLTTAIEVRSYP